MEEGWRVRVGKAEAVPKGTISTSVTLAPVWSQAFSENMMAAPVRVRLASSSIPTRPVSDALEPYRASISASSSCFR